MVANYEDRVRAFSSLERVRNHCFFITLRFAYLIFLFCSFLIGKIFRYFATVSVDGVPYMRQEDFIRSITPGQLQPESMLFQFDIIILEYRMDIFEKVASANALVTVGATLFEHDANGK